MYTSYLRDRFRLDRAEFNLEVPLDSITAKELRKHSDRGTLPKWQGIKRVTPKANAAFQRQAQLIADRLGIARVHLDTYWWGGREDFDS
jgi:hypothetical protein